MYWVKGCGRCGGCLARDGDELRCLQCGRRFYPAGLAAIAAPAPVQAPVRLPGRKHRKSQLAAHGGVNYAGRAKRLDDAWWLRNAEVIRRLDAGDSVNVIAWALKKPQRTIRLIREVLADRRLSLKNGVVLP